MAAIKREPPPTGPIADLFDRLDDLHSKAGRPSMREIAIRAGRGEISSSTVHNLFRSSAVPRWAFLARLIRAQSLTDLKEGCSRWAPGVICSRIGFVENRSSFSWERNDGVVANVVRGFSVSVSQADDPAERFSYTRGTGSCQVCAYLGENDQYGMQSLEQKGSEAQHRAVIGFADTAGNVQILHSGHCRSLDMIRTLKYK